MQQAGQPISDTAPAGPSIFTSGVLLAGGTQEPSTVDDRHRNPLRAYALSYVSAGTTVNRSFLLA
jgi:hypothetical protein